MFDADDFPVSGEWTLDDAAGAFREAKHPLPASVIKDGGWKVAGYVSDSEDPSCKGGVFDFRGLAQQGTMKRVPSLQIAPGSEAGVTNLTLLGACPAVYDGVVFPLRANSVTPLAFRIQNRSVPYVVILNCVGANEEAMVCRLNTLVGETMLTHYFGIGKTAPR